MGAQRSARQAGGGPAARGPRRIAELAARVVALTVLAWLLVETGRPRAVERTEIAASDSLGVALRRWSTSLAPARVHVRVMGDVQPSRLDWLSALTATGTAVAWDENGLLPLAAAAEPLADPAGGTGVWVAAPAGTPLDLMDRYGPLDSITAAGAGGRFLARSAPDEVFVGGGRLTVHAATGTVLSLGRLLLLARAGWESKFVLAALEERGWRVDARLALSPRGDVMQDVPCASPGRCRLPIRIDTATYDAVIALDSSALARAREIVGYVRSGGGLVAAGAVLAARAMEPLRVGQSLALVPAVEPFATHPADPRRDLALTPIALEDDAVALEARAAAVAVAARRVEHGRVIAVGYADTWRWRLGGGENAVANHREWWASLVARVAHAHRTSVARPAETEEAPLAHLVEELGPSSGGASRTGTGFHPPPGWLYTLFVMALIFEWASRRLRGAA